MKTAVSIPGPLFEAAEQLAARLGISRSQLYARALEHLVETESEDEVTARLDEIYAVEDSRLAPEVVEAQARAIGDGW
ncbi:MAG: ChpI protein [Acidimicrobiales bacterium]